MLNTVGLVVVGLFVIWISDWIRRWRNPKCNNGVLPPGSMGFPLIGETLSIAIPSYSLDLHSFIKTRLQRYGPIFRTSIAGQPVAISADPEFNKFLFQQEGRLVELWYLDSFAKIFSFEGESELNAIGIVHKYVRGRLLNCFGAESLKTKLLPQIEEHVNSTLSSWSTQASVEVKLAASAMVLDFSARQFMSHDTEKSVASLSETYAKVAKGLMSFPVNIPGTTYHQCLKGQKKITTMLRDLVKERCANPEQHRGDILDQIIKDMETEKFLSEDFIVQLIFGVLFTTYETVSLALALALKLLSDHPSAIEEMIAEHEAILQKREDGNSSLTWEEYKSMTFTHQVINEVLRIANTLPGILRRALKDIPVKGFTIPKGWTIMMVTAALHLSSNTFNNPLEFNPWRWKELDSHVISKNFMPFGAGTRQCAGAEYSRVLMATFFHTLLTKYRWTKVKEGKIARVPMLGFLGGIHIKLSKKSN